MVLTCPPPPYPLISCQAVREDIFEVGPEGMSVADLAAMLAVQPTEVVKFLFMKVGVGGGSATCCATATALLCHWSVSYAGAGTANFGPTRTALFHASLVCNAGHSCAGNSTAALPGGCGHRSVRY